MKLFSCPSCQQVVFFSNVVCERCNHALGYEPASNRILALEPAEDGFWVSVGQGSDGKGWKYDANYAHGVCNWVLPSDSPDTLSLASRFNMTIPNLDNPDNLPLWQKMELAKQRLFYTLLRLDLPLVTRAEHKEGLGFQFLSDEGGQNVMTGHDEGIITIALAEADDAEREKRRSAMGEPYRTLLGHFRHEIGHWYWDLLVRDGGALEECRAIFGDDTLDYGQALQTHYANGPKPNWQEEYVSSYAASHAWEDFAETWAHYLHIVDTLEVGGSYGIAVHPKADREGILSTNLDFKVFGKETTIEEIMEAWLALSAALNSFNRAMGHQDLYPFVLSPAVVAKLGFIHDLVHGRIGRGREAVEEAVREQAKLAA
ncbi:zinc-binding metallopeptidase family protein [Aureimonas psammosilenae]|uniref:zinc-binding metallopeptidase family protein n=1 Tax=Aureimonas psammosilenae TaxID=2495496 RepID=UPI001260DE30|nr:putative zinc-binding peptidase [Aureimonas psammosilenae]